MKTVNSLRIKTSLLVILVNFSLTAQESLRGFGIRIGGYAAYQGLSYKEFLSPSFSLETVFGKNTGTDNPNFSLQFNFQHNMDISKYENLTWYFGAGPKVLYWYEGAISDSRGNVYYDKTTKYNFGINTLIGLNSKIGNLPLSVSLDCGPSINVFPYTKVNFMLNSTIHYLIKNNKFTAHTHLRKKSYKRSHGRF